MPEIPQAVLSEHFQERMKGRRLHSAVFLTYQFDPGFFEQEVLPVFLDVPLSHATAIRLLQLEDALRELPGQVAVYYDASGLVIGDAGSAKLDVRRVPVQHSSIFHPKNVLLLVDNEESDQAGYRRQTLITACLSANLTRSGWWENVESCHVEEISEGERTWLKNDLTAFLSSLRRKATAEREHSALRDLLAFLKSAGQRQQKSVAGRLQTHFYAGQESIADFLDRAAGTHLRGAYLEIISPYFDDAVDCAPLNTLIERFSPRKVRVHLPRSSAGEALVRQELFESVRSFPSVSWGQLPRALVRTGRDEAAGDRFIHAKVYRFFTPSPKREFFFIGSANLTSPAHRMHGNVETGFLVDVVPPRRPSFWLEPDQREPIAFLVRTENSEVAASGTRLNLRYHWDHARAEAFWDATTESPPLRIEARGLEIGTISSLPPREWVETPPDMSRLIGDVLEETSLFFVHSGGDEPALLLVQEEGMSHKPSLLMQLSAADILRYWSLLTAEQRAAFLEARAPEIALTGQGADLVARARLALDDDTMFDRFAGVFHAFGCLERAVRSALAADHQKEADYRLFGRKYDSLLSLLDRVESERSESGEVESYVIIMCAHQLCREIAHDFPEYWKQHVVDVRALQDRLSSLAVVRESLHERNGDGFGHFLDWFDRWFLKRAKPVEVEG